MLAVCSQAQLNPSCPEHVAAVWLHALVWVGNARWRGLQEAVPLEQLSRLLAGLHGYAALLQLVFGHPPAEETGEHAPAAALLVHTQKHAMAAFVLYNCQEESTRLGATSAQHLQPTIQGTTLARNATSSSALLKLWHKALHLTCSPAGFEQQLLSCWTLLNPRMTAGRGRL